MMYARVVSLQFRPGFLDGFLTVYQERAVPDLLQRRGFDGALVLTAADTHTGMLLSLWDTQEDVRKSHSHSQRIVSAILLPFLAQTPALEAYDVCVQSGHYMGGTAARILTLPIVGEQLDDALAIYNQELLPELKRQAGFQGVFWLADRAAGTGYGLSLWTSPETMRAADASGAFFPSAAEKLASFFRQPPVVTYYTVSNQL